MTTALIMAAYAVGFRIGWTLVDRWLDSIDRKRASSMRNITPGRVA